MHEAGYDAYMAGVCFIRLAHRSARLRHKAPPLTTSPTLRDMLEAVAEHMVPYLWMFSFI